MATIRRHRLRLGRDAALAFLEIEIEVDESYVFRRGKMPGGHKPPFAPPVAGEPGDRFPGFFGGENYSRHLITALKLIIS